MNEAYAVYKDVLADGTYNTRFVEVNAVEYDVYRGVIIVDFKNGSATVLSLDNVAQLQVGKDVEIKRVVHGEGDVIYGR